TEIKNVLSEAGLTVEGRGEKELHAGCHVVDDLHHGTALTGARASDNVRHVQGIGGQIAGADEQRNRLGRVREDAYLHTRSAGAVGSPCCVCGMRDDALCSGRSNKESRAQKLCELKRNKLTSPRVRPRSLAPRSSRLSTALQFGQRSRLNPCNVGASRESFNRQQRHARADGAISRRC